MAPYRGPLARLTPGMINDPSLLGQARQIHQPGDAEACLRARRFLDQALRNVSEPEAERLTYKQAAERLDAAGRHDEAVFLRELTNLVLPLVDAAEHWLHRYEERTETFAQRDHRLVLTPGIGELWGETCAGIDGMLYTAGLCRFPAADDPVVLVQGRGSIELFTRFDSVTDAQAWVRDDRCATDLRPMTPPSVTPPPRVVREERVLSCLLRRPWELGRITEWLPATTFTADLRYEIFAALHHIRCSAPGSTAEESGPPDVGQVTRETLRRLAWSPDWDNPYLGGPGTPLAEVYLRRLAATNVSTNTATEAANWLFREDATAAFATREAVLYLRPPVVGAHAVAALPKVSTRRNQSTSPNLLAPPADTQPEPGSSPRI
jgi:hypothetical protein